MPTTAIPDVAKRAVVSISTVSRMNNGRNRVHPQTRPRIRKAIRQLDYEQIAPPTHWLSTCCPGTITGASPVSPTPPPRQPTAICIPQLGELITTRLADATAKRWMYDKLTLNIIDTLCRSPLLRLSLSDLLEHLPEAP